VARHSPTSHLLRIGAAILIAAIAEATPGAAFATVVTSAGNIPYSGMSPGGVNMATGELILVMRPDLAIDGPFPVVFRRYYASMLAREGLASGHLGPNWLGTYDWSLSVVGSNATLVTNRGAAIRFTQGPVGAWDLVSPTYAKFKLDVLAGGTWRVTNPLDRRLYFFDGTSWLLTQIVDEHGNALSLSYTGGRLTQVSDGLGRALQFGYDPTGLLTQVSDGTRSVHYAYTGGVLTNALDANGQPWTYAYQPVPIQGLLTGVTEPFGNTPLTQAYDPMGRVMSQTDGLSNMAMYAYDAPPGNVFTDPLGNPWTYLHDTQNRLMTLTDPMSGPTSFAYDPLGRPSMIMRPMGDMTSFAYDPASGYLGTLTRADGMPISWGYGSHLVGGATLFDLSTAGYPDGTTEGYGRDPAGNLTDYTDRAGFHWFGTYNARGQVLTATNPSGGVTTIGYAANFTVVLLSDNAGNATSFSYDGLSRLTQVTWPDLAHRNYAYDNLDGLTSLTDERGKAWSYAYDANERLMTETDPLLEPTGYQYDAIDRVTQEVDPLGHATGYAYDGAGRLMSTTDRTGRATGYQYDALGRLAGVSDPAGGTTAYSYDADSRLIGVQDPLSHSRSFGYDMLDRITHMTDPVGTGFDYTYDAMGRILTANAPLGHMETFGYDPRGLLTSFFDVTAETDLPRTSLGEASQLTDPNHNVWPRGHDPQGRITSVADPLARTTTFEYDPQSRPIHIGRPDGTLQQISYDPAGRMTGVSYTDGTNFLATWSDANRLTGATGASFAYDAAGRMTNSNGFVMTYDNEGRILSETYAPGKVVSYAYDTRGLPSQMTDWLGGITSFTHDAAQRLTGITRANGETATYAYDAADRLVSSVETRPPPSGSPLSSISITRDALGQPASIDRRQPLMPGITMPSTTSFTYDPASQVEGFSYDPLGRLLSDGSRSFQWDGASRLTHYAAGADSPRFTYDAFGSVRTQTLGGQTVQLGWNYGNGYPTNDDTQVNLPTPHTSYNIHAPSGLLLYSIDGSTGARSFYHYDEDGNTMFLTNDLGSVVTEYSYTPVGGVTVLGQTGNNFFTWNGAAGAMQLGSSGLFRVGGGIYDAIHGALVSGLSKCSGLKKTTEMVEWTDPEDKARHRSRPTQPTQVSVMSYRYQFEGIPTHPGGDPLSREDAGTLLHEIGHRLSLSHGGGGSGDLGEHGGEASDPSTWPVARSFADLDDMPVPMPPWLRGRAAWTRYDFSHGSVVGGSLNEGSGLAEVLGNDVVVTLGPHSSGDGLSDTWEMGRRGIDIDCSGQCDGGGGANFDPRKHVFKHFGLFGHDVVDPPADPGLADSPVMVAPRWGWPQSPVMVNGIPIPKIKEIMITGADGPPPKPPYKPCTWCMQ
jgi:YD repeat-containing protein